MRKAILTIDDSPSPAMKKHVDFLLKNKIPAIFFCRGDFLELRQESAIYAIKKGFIIANHAYSHEAFSELSLEQCKEEINKTDQIIEVLYKKAGVTRKEKYFRFPFGDRGGGTHGIIDRVTGRWYYRINYLQKHLKKLGYTKPNAKITYSFWNKHDNCVDWFWSFDAREYLVFAPHHEFGKASSEQTLARLERDEPENELGLNSGNSDEIILMHDNPETFELTKKIIKKIQSKGFKFVKPN